MTEEAEFDSATSLLNQMLGMGYTAKEAEPVIERMIMMEDEHGDAKAEYRKLYPLRIWDEAARSTGNGDSFLALDKTVQNNIAWHLGLNTKSYNLYITGGCYTWDDKQECGIYCYSSERDDKAWRTQVVDGRNVASMEVRLTEEEREVMHTQRTNTKG
jgi:hypothetical protein